MRMRDQTYAKKWRHAVLKAPEKELGPSVKFTLLALSCGCMDHDGGTAFASITKMTQWTGYARQTVAGR